MPLSTISVLHSSRSAAIQSALDIILLSSRKQSYEELRSDDDGRPKLRATMSLNGLKVIMKLFDDKHTQENRRQRQRDKVAVFKEIWEMFLSRCRLYYPLGAS